MTQGEKRKIYVSDFDGTLTTADSMFHIIRFHRGMVWLCLNMLLLSPVIVAMFLGWISNHRTKEILLHRCFGGMSEEDFCHLCQRFADARRSSLIRTQLYASLLAEQRNGNTVVVVTASPERWVRCFVPDFRVIGTKLEFTDAGFTGHFLTPNCYGQEKVNRLLAEFPELKEHRDDYYVKAYGDSRGDRELILFADEGEMIV